MVIDEYGYGGFKPNYALVDGQDNIIVADDYYALMYKSPDRWIQVSPNSFKQQGLLCAANRNGCFGSWWFA